MQVLNKANPPSLPSRASCSTSLKRLSIQRSKKWLRLLRKPIQFFLSYVSELLNKNPEACFGKGYPNAEKRAKLITYGSAKVGEPWISFYGAEEIESVLSQNGYSIKENVTLKDLNSRYFTPVGRTLSENQLFQLEHFLIAKSQN